ncbi:solute carrier organic anion transporter family member 2B1 isoform X1 [Hippocampus zosterae]|uniref:solute carrier organic anion transporter family member 2B1 isoform X1 n=1 Tax=Hippocampus zosterae TaxID=109293 RepID=UPI00223DA9D2|nr:solute carrier organic anion transporter family member 2B1 isoform X1 [Hippocampus zosterae]
MEARSRNVFGTVKVFVACHSVLQLSQLLVSGYMKSSISTIERRYGLSSQKSGLLAAFNEVGNTLLIVLVSFLGSRVHRPRAIGCGALLACLASLLMALPHFLSGPYRYGERRYHGDDRAAPAWNGSGLCRRENVAAEAPSSNGSCGERGSFAHEGVYPLLLFAQLLLGVASVPMQPFGISYIDDHASRKNSPLYLGILLAVTAVGPAFGFLGGAFLLRFYVDFDKMAADEAQLDRGDLRWVGAWWLGFLVASCLLFAAALPYFFFPRSMVPEEESEADQKRQPDVFQEVGLLHFLKSFPAMLCRTLRSPVYLLVVLAQVNLAAMVAGLATFMAKFIEKQFGQTADFSNVMIGGVSIPLAVLGTVSGGVLVRRRALGVGGASKLCAAAILLSLCCAFPLILLGCPTQTVDGVFPPRRAAARCASTCRCARDLFRPVCGSDGVEFTFPCHAGCVAMETDGANKVTVRTRLLALALSSPLREKTLARVSTQNFTECDCVGGAGGWAAPGTCGGRCGHLLWPFVVLMAATCLTASLCQTPSFVIILRTVSAQDKSLAVGIQYMLFRVLAFMPCPVLYGFVIDSACVLWDRECGKQTSCLYYDLDGFRHRPVSFQQT